jgi:hypothetical protein
VLDLEVTENVVQRVWQSLIGLDNLVGPGRPSVARLREHVFFALNP